MRIRFLLMCGIMPLAAPARAEVPPDFSGTWVAKNGAATDSGKPASSDTSHGGRGMGGHGGGHGGMGGMGGGHHGRHGADSSPAAPGESANVAMSPRVRAHTLIIRQSEVVFDIAADGQRTAYRFDNRNNYGPQYGGTVNLTWSVPDMVIETHPDAGGSVEERYTLAPNGKLLTLHARMQRAGEDTAREFTRTFARDDAGATPAGNQPTLP